MNEGQANRIIELLESIDETQKKLLKKQEEADAMMDVIASRFDAQEEEKPEKSTDAFFNQGLAKQAFSEINSKPFQCRVDISS